MLEIIVFAVVLAAAQFIGGLAILALMMNEKFLRYYTKKMVKFMNEINKELMEDFENEL